MEKQHVSVAASEIQKSFGQWPDRTFHGPVETTKSGPTSAFLVSPPLLKAMWASFRQAAPTAHLPNSEVYAILSSEVVTDQPWTPDGLPNQEGVP
jgi:hypothetical protein